MSGKTILVWFRKDLRIHDNEILTEAVRKGDHIIPVYCFDPRHFEVTPFNTSKTGIIRTKFLLESVADLRKSFQNAGGDLVIRVGKPEVILPELVAKYKVYEVYHHREVASEETGVSALVEDALWKLKINLKHFIGHTLYHKEDLPFPINNIPDVFTNFRTRTEKDASIRSVFEKPVAIHSIHIPALELPELAIFNLSKMPKNPKAVLDFKGGETSGLERIQHYFHDSKAVSSYKKTRNGLIGADYSTKFSPWLALGCISPRIIYKELKKYEQENGANDSTYWVLFELLWRDYFRFMVKKHQYKYFLFNGIKDEKNTAAPIDMEKLNAWKNGETDNDYVNANLVELKLTGFMSNRGRQIVASYFINELALDWRYGAAYFEEQLIDYDVCSNWGNWAYLAGVGNDPRGKRAFNMEKQAHEYDPKNEYRNLWLEK